MNVEYTVYEKYYLTTSKWKVNQWSGWLDRTITGVAGTWSRHILRWCHIHFITPKTYSALLPSKAYDSPNVWNEFVRVTKHFLRSIFRYYDVCMTHFVCSFTYNDLHFEHTTTAKTNIRANRFQMLLNHALTSTCNKNAAELRSYMYNLCPQTTEPNTVTRVHESSTEITGISTGPQWSVNVSLETKTCGAISGCDGVTCSRLGSVGIFVCDRWQEIVPLYARWSRTNHVKIQARARNMGETRMICDTSTQCGWRCYLNSLGNTVVYLFSLWYHTT